VIITAGESPEHQTLKKNIDLTEELVLASFGKSSATVVAVASVPAFEPTSPASYAALLPSPEGCGPSPLYPSPPHPTLCNK
jgi:hypothetical protein